VARQYKQSPKGIALHAWINKADVKFNADGLYHVDHIMEGDDAEAFRKKIDEQVEEALREHTKEMKPGEAKKWGPHYPYIVEENEDTGAETGRIVFKYKQNAVIHMEDGTKKPIKISVRDAKNKVTATPIYSGDVIKLLYAPRVTVATSNKTVGVRLDFCAAQIIKKQERKGGGGGFSEEDGYEDEHGFNEEEQEQSDNKAPEKDDGDY
jgi:hypothetical protein